MESIALFQQDTASMIIQRAINAHSVSDVDELEKLIVQDIGRRFERPVGDRVNNHGLEYKTFKHCIT